jgi:RNA polymerase sigma-70 factor (ECF subfamily)
LQPVDVEDVSQYVLSRVAQAIKSFEYDPSRGKFRAWLGKITSNAVNNHFVRSSGEKPLNLAVDPLDYRFEDMLWSEVFAQQVLTTACERIQSNFDSKTWLCFWMSWMERQPVAEIADQLGISIHAVYVKKSRVLKRLEQEVVHLVDEF